MKTWTLNDLCHFCEYGPRVGESVPDAFVESTPLTLTAGEMLDALRYCKGTIEQLVDQHDRNGAWLLARDVIAKAEGRNGND